MTYTIEIERPAAKYLARLPKNVQTRIRTAIAALSEDPRPAASTQMVGYENVWRLRIGDYRVVYMIKDDVLIVTVLKVGHRKDVYERR